MVDEKDGSGFADNSCPWPSAWSWPRYGGRSADPAAFVPVAMKQIQRLQPSSPRPWTSAERCDEPFVVVSGSFYLVGEAMERLGVSPTHTESERLSTTGAPRNAWQGG